MENTERKDRVLSMIQPTSVPTLGNYLGALKNWKQMSADNDCIFAVADLHAITVRQEPAKLRKQSLEMYALMTFCVSDAYGSRYLALSGGLRSRRSGSEAAS